MAFRIITVLCALALAWSAYEWGRIVWLVRAAQTPRAAFLVYDKGEGRLMLNEFTDYVCNNCAAFHKAVAGLRALHPDLGYTVRPVAWVNEESDKLTRLALAAGTQGKFRDIHEAFMEYGGGSFDEVFLRETFSLYGMDYDDMLARSQQPDITAMMDDNNEDSGRLGAGLVPSVVIGRVVYTAPLPIENVTVQDMLPALAQARQTR